MTTARATGRPAGQPWFALVVGTCVIVALVATSLVAGAGGSAPWSWASVATQALLLATVATSWNIVGGYLGHIDLAHVAYFGVGAYGTGVTETMLGWGLPASLVAGACLAAATATVAGSAILRLHGLSFAIATLGLLVLFREGVRLAGPLTGGGRGLVLPPVSAAVVYYAAVMLFAVAVMVSWRLRHTSLWPVVLAVREDEQGAAVRGIRTTPWKHTIYTAAALITGTAGGLWAYQSTFIDPDLAFADARSLDMITATLLGGVGTVIGPIIGSLILFAGRAYLGPPSDAAQMLLQGLVLIGIVRWLPRGIVGWLTGWWKFPAALARPRGGASASQPAPPARSSEARPFGDCVLEVRGLSTPDSGTTVLEGIDLCARSGEILGLIGPNGSGKTTLVDCLCRLRPIDNGTIRLSGQDVTRHSAPRLVRAGLGRTFQVRRVYRQLTVADNLLLCTHWTMASVGRRPPAAVEGRMSDLLSHLELSPLADTLAGDLSAGQQRLLEIGMALMRDPQVLLLDEATAGVPPSLVTTVKAVVRSCADQGMAVVVVEHDVGVVADLCHRVVVLDRGQIVAEGTPASVMASGVIETAYIGATEG